jgi:hypothetical protein
MAKQVPTFTDPAQSSGINSLVLRNNFNTLGSYLNDHDAQHWPIKVSAPKIGTGGVSAIVGSTATGATMTANQAKYMRFTYETPNGETTRSSEATVTLTTLQNSVQVTVDQVDSGFTPYMWVYVALAGASAGAGPWYRCRQADLAAVSGCTVDANGRVTLNTAGQSQFKIIVHPPNTQPAAPASNNSGSIDPLQMTVTPIPFSSTVTNNSPSTGQKTVTKTYPMAGGTVTETGIYDMTLNRITSHELWMGGVAIARYSYTYGTDSASGSVICTARTQLEA